MSKEKTEKLLATLPDLLGDRAKGVTVLSGEVVVTTAREMLFSVLKTLKEEVVTRFDMLMDISGVDYPERPERFELAYHLLSPAYNMRLRVKTNAAEETPVASVIGLYPSAGWYEREIYDLFGVLFAGHPDLRRILTDYGFEGHPLRKDFPLSGHLEVRYDDEQKRVVYEPVKFAQDYRSFDNLSPWEGMTAVQLPGDEKAANPVKLMKKG